MNDWLCPAWVFAALFALFAGPARADVVRPPPEDCPPDSFPGSSHCGPVCVALICINDGECRGGNTCQPAKACLSQDDCLVPPLLVHGGPCLPEDLCLGEGETCQSVKLCLPAGDTTSGDSGDTTVNTSTSTGGTSTSTGGTSTGGTSTGSTSTGSTSTGSTGSTSTTATTDVAPTSGGLAGTSSSGASSSSGSGASSSSGGTGDKGGCSGCVLADGPQSLLGLLVIAGFVRRRRVVRPA